MGWYRRNRKSGIYLFRTNTSIHMHDFIEIVYFSLFCIPCTMLSPLGQIKPLPTIICLQRHSSGKHISMGEAVFEGDEKVIPGRDFALQAVKEKYCAIVMNQRYMGMTEHDAQGNPGCIIYNSTLAAIMMGRTAIGERV